jgi:predicted unusual protein kinase regulating ubiquinone biosynthesis (AarF/ABC1/UbiB family)
MQGKWHWVYSGVTLLKLEKIVQAHPKWTEAMREQLIVAVHEKYHLDRVLLENLFQVSIRARPKFDMGYGTTKAPAVRSAKIASAGREAKVRAMEFYPPTKEQALRLLNDPDQWIQRLAGVPRNERISIHKAVFGDVTPAPYTIYDLNRSEPLQRAIWKAVQPKSDREVIELWGKLAAKGTTEFTDGLFDKEVLPRLERSPHFAEQAERFLDERLVWDMTIREKLWNLWYERSPLLRDLKGSGIGKRDAALQKLRRHVVDAFPEVTPTRAAVVERLSNEIRTNATEAERMEHWKTSGGVSGYAVRVLNAIIDSAKTAPNDTKLMLLKYLRGDDMNRADTINYFNTRTVDLSGGLSSSSALYEKMKNLKLGSLIEDMGYERLQRAWSTIDPRAQAVIATPLLVGPDGILATPTGRQGFTREMVPTRSNAHAMEIREAIVDYMQALVNTGRDYRESTAQAFIFFQSKPAANRTLGDMIAAICEAEGPIGIALGQRLANLELFDPESNARLHALKERVKLMTRHEKYQYLKGFEYELNGENILLPEPLGGASMKEVGEIQTSSTETEAVGMLRKGAATLISQNGATLREFLKLRAQKKPEVYGHLVPVLDNVIKKKGAEADGKREEISARVSTELVKRQQPRSQWRLEAVDVKHDRIGDREILRMPVVRGERFAALPPEIQAEVAQELINVYAPEFLGEGGLVEGYVITEADIHDGNIIVDRKNKRIFLFDRSQMEAVPKQEVRQYLDLLTTVGARRKFDNKLVTQQIVRSIGNVSRQAVPNELASDIDQYFAKPYEGELTGRKVVADLLAVQRLAGTRGVYLSDGFQDWLNMGQNLAWLEKKVPAGRPFNTRMETALTQRGLQLYTGGGVETVSGPAPQCLGVRSLARHLNIKTDE